MKQYRPLTEQERDFCLFVLTLPQEHDSQGCPATRMYEPLEKMAKNHGRRNDFVIYMNNMLYDDGRSCPMRGMRHTMLDLLKHGLRVK